MEGTILCSEYALSFWSLLSKKSETSTGQEKPQFLGHMIRSIGLPLDQDDPEDQCLKHLDLLYFLSGQVTLESQVVQELQEVQGAHPHLEGLLKTCNVKYLIK